MPVLKKRVRSNQDKLAQNNGLYVHSSPPRVLQLNSAYIKQLIRSGDVHKLEQIVLEGKGKKLIGEYSADYKVRTFLKSVPSLMSKISLLHDAVNSGRLEELKALLDEEPERKRKLVTAKDEAGVGLLHKAVYYDLKDIALWLVQNHPQTVPLKDSEGRTAYHYTVVSKDASAMQKLLVGAGADASALDSKQHSARFYGDHVSDLELPSSHKSFASSRKSTAHKESLVIKKSNIRIWIHQRDLGHLQQVVWEGHGSKLLVEHSNNPKVRKFLEAVPRIMGLIKDVHVAVQNDDLEGLKGQLTPPIPSIVLSGKDANGLAPLHKAAGLGRQEIAEYIVAEYPNSVFQIENEGKTPLHYAALVKDDGKMFDFLIESGADESVLDNKQKSAAFYKTRNTEIDQKLLQVIPECPRMAKDSFPANWDWGMLIASTPTEIKKEPFGDSTETEINKTVDELLNGNETTEVKQVEEINGTGDEPAIEEQDENKDEEAEKETVDEAAIEDAPTEEAHTEEPPTQEEEPEPELEESVDQPEEVESKVEPEEQEDEQQKEDSDDVVEAETEELPKSNHSSRPASNVSRKLPNGTANHHEDIDDQEGVIEGVVNGENEVESVNEEGQSSSNEHTGEPDIAEMVEAGNMEQLAGLVLNGEGDKLIGQHSDNADLQAFLDSVPVYMTKINKIHLGARNGNLKELQAALDRRKFAVAKDQISPNGASPLHTAIIFGNTSIVRYLAGRFPETIQCVDNNGRTPLHYAAVLQDNGHYYNLLVHLGANPKAGDKVGHTPEFYRIHQTEFTHRTLLEDFGAEATMADEILTDKDNPNQAELPFFCTEEGRYLASSLGDPLIKGLTEVANKRPEDPIAYLATYLYNFANGTTVKTQENQDVVVGPPQQVDDNKAVPATIDVVTVTPEEGNVQELESAFNSTSRDEHGQSMLHFAAARSHGRNALFQLLLETEINVSYRDELYRTARDISIQANIPENTAEVDRYILHVASNGDTNKLVELLLNGYDHIIDLVDEEDCPIVDVVSKNNQPATVTFLQSILAFEERRERVHHAIREGNLNEITLMLADENDTGSGKLLAIGRNSYGRCTLHIAVLCQQEEIVDFVANTFPETLHLGDNLERTPLHYAMGVEKMETISRVLIKAGAKRVMKDLKGRQPTYYFMNKSDIARLQEEEETF